MTKHHLKQIKSKVKRQLTFTTRLRNTMRKFFTDKPFSWYCEEIPGIMPMDNMSSGTVYEMNIIKK